MIFAAGLGTRLGEITRDTPKALVEVGGRPALEHVALRLIAAGADRLIINVHHHADRVCEFVESRTGFGVEVLISREDGAPLETGGGLRHAAPLFRRDAPFLLHNVDVIADVDLRVMYANHVASSPMATLAIHERASSRHLLFDNGRLVGRSSTGPRSRAELYATAADPRGFAFAGIHVVSPAILDLITEDGAFSITDLYLRLAGLGHWIAGHDVTGAPWFEIGNPERLEAARRALGA